MWFQQFRLNREGQLTSGEWCVTPIGDRLQTGHCRKGTVDGPFEFREVSHCILVCKLNDAAVLGNVIGAFADVTAGGRKKDGPLSHS